MAVDCSQLSKAIFDAARYHVQNTKGVNNIDDAIDVLLKEMPQLDRKRIILSIAEASRLSKEVRDEIQETIDEVKKYGKKGESAAAQKVEEKLKAKNKPITVADLKKEMKKIDAGMANLDNSIDRLSKKFARAFIKEGDRDRDSVVQKVWDEMKGYDEDISRTRIVDAISDYGKFQKASSDPTDVILSGMRSELQKIRALEDMESGEAPKATGQERHPPTDRYRTLLKQVNEAKRQGGYKVSKHGNELRTSIEATITRLENKKKDLKSENDAKKQAVKGTVDHLASATKDDLARIKELGDDIKVLQASHRTIFKAEYDAKKTARAIIAAEKATQRFMDKLQNSEFQRFDERPPVKVNDKLSKARSDRDKWRKRYEDNNPYAPNVKAARKRKKELLGHLTAGTLPEARDKKGDPANDYLKELQSEIKELSKGLRESEQSQYKGLEDRLERLLGKLHQTDYIPPAPAKTPKSQRVADLQTDVSMIEKRVAAHLRNLEPRGRREYLSDVLGVSRAFKTAIDLSAVSIQGGILSYANPEKMPAAFADMIRVLHPTKGDEVYRRQMREINTRGNGRNARNRFEAGLFLSSEEGGLTAREEEFATTLIDKAMEWHPALKVILTPIHISELAYKMFLNRMRADVFDSLHATLGRGGDVSIEKKRLIGNYVNIGSGRGELYAAARASGLMNSIFFAPRHLVSRFQFILGQPFFHSPRKGKTKGPSAIALLRQGDSSVAKLLAREYAKVMIGWAVYQTFDYMVLGDDDDEETTMNLTEPRSSDFLRRRTGNTVVDNTAGLSSAVTLISRLSQGVGAGGGQVVTRRGKRTLSLYDLARYEQYKLSPIMSAVIQKVTNKKVMGKEKYGWKDVLEDLMLPIYLGELRNIFKDEGISSEATVSAILALFGKSVQVQND